jgi:hypothetical protein
LRSQDLPQIIAGVQKEIASYTKAEPQFDDITMLALKFAGKS